MYQLYDKLRKSEFICVNVSIVTYVYVRFKACLSDCITKYETNTMVVVLVERHHD